MERTVQLWLQQGGEQIDFIAQLATVVDPWGTHHVRLTPDSLRELLDVLSDHVDDDFVIEQRNGKKIIRADGGLKPE